MEFIIAFLCAALSGMGVGGGGLFLIYLTLAAGADQKEAQLCNLLFFLAASAASLLCHVTRRRISPAAVGALAAGGIPGALLGAAAARAMSADALSVILGVFLLAAGALSLRRTLRQPAEGKTDKTKK